METFWLLSPEEGNENEQSREVEVNKFAKPVGGFFERTHLMGNTEAENLGIYRAMKAANK